jgi:hypothetical protein
MGAVLAAFCLVFGGCGKAPDAATGKISTADAKNAQADGKGGATDRKANAGESKESGDESGESKADAGAEKADQAEKGKEGLTLTPEQLEKLGVTTQPAQAMEYRAETPGYGVVLEHQAIAQAVADLQTAEATARFSKASLERARQLQGTPGAVSTDVEQTAEQKAAVDSATLMLTTEKLSTTWGMQPPWKDNVHDPRVQSLAHGRMQLVRVTFPLGALPGTPAELHGGRVGTTRPDATATMRPVWMAQADATIPGRSFFTLLPTGTVAEGERLQVWAATGAPISGVLIPTAAIVLSSGKYWCYVEKTPGTFTRVEVDTSKPVSGGYIVTEDVKPGDKIAVTAVGQLLAKETGASEEPD